MSTIPTIIRTCAEDIESVRRTVNQTSSGLPPELESAFQAALDQIADRQYEVSKALSLILQEGSVITPEQESALNAAVAGARQSGLRACRGYADLELRLAEEVEKNLLTAPINAAELEREKQGLDKRFAMIALDHENNKIQALDPLVAIAADYKDWQISARATIRGNEKLVANENRRMKLQTAGMKLQTVGILVAIALGLLNFFAK